MFLSRKVKKKKNFQLPLFLILYPCFFQNLFFSPLRGKSKIFRWNSSSFCILKIFVTASKFFFFLLTYAILLLFFWNAGLFLCWVICLLGYLFAGLFVWVMLGFFPTTFLFLGMLFFFFSKCWVSFGGESLVIS